MKICKIINTHSPYTLGGVDITDEDISGALKKRGNDVVVITINPKRGDVIDEIDGSRIYRLYPSNISTVHSIGKESIIRQGIWTLLDFYSYPSYSKIKSILRKEKPDLVHIHTPVDVTLSAFDAVKSLKLPLVFTLHDFYLLCRRVILLHGSGEICTRSNESPLCRIYRLFTKRIIDAKPDIVIASSQFVLDMYKKNGFFNNSKSVVLHHGIELGDVSNIQENKRNYKEGDNFNILYVGGLTKHKGVHILINAVKQIKNENITLHIVGDGIYKEKLKYLAENDNRIIFYGKLPNKQVQGFYRTADILVVPSICYEVFGYVILEAFRAGLAVIGSRIGGIPELIRDNFNSFLFNPGDVEELRRILCEIIVSPVKLKEFSRNTYLSVRQYNMPEYVDALIKIYEEAIRINNMRQRQGALVSHYLSTEIH